MEGPVLKIIMLSISSLLFAYESHAVAVHDFLLRENDKVAASCDVDGAKIRSKFKIYVTNLGSSSTTIAVKANLCTVKYGFRKLNLQLVIPTMTTQIKSMSDLAIGQTRQFNLNGQNITVTRNQDGSSGRMAFNIDGVDPQDRASNIYISVPKDASEFGAIRNSKRLQLPWMSIRFSVSQGFAGTFSFDGRLNEIQLD